MDYQWTESLTYYAFPTILPFSPFSKNKFYFSILGQIYNKNSKNILFIAAHEISHLIFYDFLEKMNIAERKKGPNEDVKNYFKETLTAVLLNQKPLSDILKLKNYSGNPEIHGLKIQKSNGKIDSFFDFLQNYYQTNKIKKEKHFSVFLKEIIGLLELVAKEFSKKRSIWNRYGNQLSKNHKAFADYQKPIKITG